MNDESWFVSVKMSAVLYDHELCYNSLWKIHLQSIINCKKDFPSILFFQKSLILIRTTELNRFFWCRHTQIRYVIKDLQISRLILSKFNFSNDTKGDR